MRIIAGDFKGRRLETPENYDIRPTTDKVKEAMFSIIAPNLPGSVCVDLFSGTGNLGLEAVSRGAAKCYFCDSSRISLNIIKRNIEYCRAGEYSKILAGDFRKSLERIKEEVDIFLLDPPYDADLYKEAFEKIRELRLLAEDGVIVAEHRNDRSLDEEIVGFNKIKERRYGHIVLSIYGF